MPDLCPPGYRPATMDDCRCVAHGHPWFAHGRSCPVRTGCVEDTPEEAPRG